MFAGVRCCSSTGLRADNLCPLPPGAARFGIGQLGKRRTCFTCCTSAPTHPVRPFRRRTHGARRGNLARTRRRPSECTQHYEAKRSACDFARADAKGPAQTAMERPSSPNNSPVAPVAPIPPRDPRERLREEQRANNHAAGSRGVGVKRRALFEKLQGPRMRRSCGEYRREHSGVAGRQRPD